ncbi:DHH family phosphoesterase [Haloarchaeobius sp. HRN-SO-5]|uniref:DHH family phosphoesterase n=1 Tax=Haloarchaeobius sp. HRN-SO-5 TaxID=3446118 RepID=UPI003EB75462
MTDLDALARILDSAGTLGIVCHDSPDPDCIASAFALRTIAEDRDVASVDILYSGDISHQQNRAFVNLLEIELLPVDRSTIDEYDALAFVDHAIPGRNTAVPRGTSVDVVVDHHPVPDDVDVVGRFVDVRESYGATASILVEYLDEFEVEPGPHLSSALLFALHRECLDYVRNPSVHEYVAARRVLPTTDLGILERMYGAAFTPATLDAMGRAIQTRETRGAALVSSVGRTTERDALPQVAEYLLNLEGISTVLVFGIVDDSVQLSARSGDPRVDLGRVLHETYSDIGTAGGHQDKAGGRIPLGLFADLDEENEDQLDRLVSRRIVRRFFEALGLDETDG